MLRILIQEKEGCTNEEYCEMELLYGQCNRNKREAARLYDIKFPSQKHPSYCIIAHAVQRLYEIGSCHRLILLPRVAPSSMNANSRGKALLMQRMHIIGPSKIYI